MAQAQAKLGYLFSQCVLSLRLLEVVIRLTKLNDTFVSRLTSLLTSRFALSIENAFDLFQEVTLIVQVHRYIRVSADIGSRV